MSDVRYIKHYEIIDSTNNEAKRLVESECFDKPVLIFADEQTAGRGRQGKSFYSPANTGLYMTVILPVNDDISSQVTMTTRTAVAVAKALEKEYNIHPEIKWVNDIYLAGNKCCGILCEAVNDYSKMLLKYAIIGVGINISTSDWPKELRDKAGSIAKASEKRISHLSLAVTTAKSVIELISDKSNQEFLNYYRSHSNVIGREIVFVENNVENSAYAVDIDNEGSLIVEMKDADGKSCRKIINSGEVSLKI
ncbi:MAG: biotin--[acetyl-CoA-carboxylase] ligase [Lachnospiraceae bacterium]|nr:biotin--[acetyl-CoA-carboxylase] ligase [Lachnospiraceae bacterium]